MALILADAGADAMLAGTGSTFAAAFNNGWIKIYDGTPPTTANAAATGTLLVGDGRFPAVAFPNAPTNVVGVGRRITAGTMASDNGADAGGTPTYARLLKQDGVTVIAQCTVSVAGGAGDMQIDQVPIVQNAPINFISLTITMPTT